MIKWDMLPDNMKILEVKPYYEILLKKKWSIRAKRIMDFFLALFLLVLLGIPMLSVALMIKLDSRGPVLFRQERVTTYGRKFYIHKFRTMRKDAEHLGGTVTMLGDSRITRVGKKIRRYRIDEIPQLLDVISGDMSFVGTRPEAVKFVNKYTPEMMATLLMPAGITSDASIEYKDEDQLLAGATDPDRTYLEVILPQKMKINLESLRNYSFRRDIATMLNTVKSVFGR